MIFGPRFNFISTHRATSFGPRGGKGGALGQVDISLYWVKEQFMLYYWLCCKIEFATMHMEPHTL